MPRRPSSRTAGSTAPAPRQRRALLDAQLSRLQERQLAMVEETARELESLREQLQEPDQLEALQTEVERLRLENQQLHGQMGAVKNHLNSQQQQWSKVIEGLQSLAGSTGALSAALELTELPIVEQQPAAPQLVESRRPAKPGWKERRRTRKQEKAARRAALGLELKEEAAPVLPRKQSSARRLAIRAVTFALIGTACYAGGRWFLGTDSVDNGTVAGAATETTPDPATPAFDTYSESFADVPFADTKWEMLNDFEFGLTLEYPSNATNRVRVIGGSNLWFLRKNGYLLKITEHQTALNLEEWWKENEATYAGPNNLKVSRGQWKGKSAIVAESREKTLTSGTSYFFAYGKGVFEIWIKDEPAITDDGQRLTRMVESLKFTN